MDEEEQGTGSGKCPPGHGILNPQTCQARRAWRAWRAREVVPAPRFEAAAGRNGEVVVRVSGEIDIASASLFRERLTEATEEANQNDVVVDLTGVTFMDATGLAVLLHTHRQLEATGRRLMLARTTRSVARVLEVAGLDGLLGGQD